MNIFAHKQLSTLLILLLAVVIVVPQRITADESIQTVNAEDLIGTWKVDLRPTPTAEPYYQEFVVDSIDNSIFTGTFYGTSIEHGRLNLDWGKIYFAFVTSDGSGEYHHSGVLTDGRIEGLSHSIGREFLSVWTAYQK